MARNPSLQRARRIAAQLIGTPHHHSFTTSLPRPQSSAADAASQLLDTFANKSLIRRQVLDANQLQKLCLTLNRPTLSVKDISSQAPPAGTPIPHGYHLVYFTPDGTEAELGADGTDLTFNAPAPFTRRMWAGGKMQWSREAVLRVGEEVEERTRLVGAVAKKSRSVGEMVLVEVEKEFWGCEGLAVVDRRSWVFRPGVNGSDQAVVKPLEDVTRGPSMVEDVSPDGTDFPARHMRWSPVGLFRFSALTFNGHMIHYNEDWTRNVESHPGVVVHGPLNLINIINYWKDIHGNGDGPKEITYRALSPLYAGQTYQIRSGQETEAEEGKIREVTVEKDGVLCMRGEILGYDRQL